MRTMLIKLPNILGIVRRIKGVKIKSYEFNQIKVSVESPAVEHEIMSALSNQSVILDTIRPAHAYYHQFNIELDCFGESCEVELEVKYRKNPPEKGEYDSGLQVTPDIPASIDIISIYHEAADGEVINFEPLLSEGQKEDLVCELFEEDV